MQMRQEDQFIFASFPKNLENTSAKIMVRSQRRLSSKFL
jgi:hypothetical protein